MNKVGTMPKPAFRVKELADGYVVVDADGEWVSEVTKSRGAAGRICNGKLAEAGRKNRPCMCCRKVFGSDGPHNRLCDRCRHGDDASSGSYSIARRA